jgi:hypothetical protein
MPHRTQNFTHLHRLLRLTKLERLARCERGEIAPQELTAAMFVDEMVYGKGQALCIRRALLKDRSIELARAWTVGVSPLCRGRRRKRSPSPMSCTNRCGAPVNDNAGHADKYHPRQLHWWQRISDAAGVGRTVSGGPGRRKPNFSAENLYC